MSKHKRTVQSKRNNRKASAIKHSIKIILHIWLANGSKNSSTIRKHSREYFHKSKIGGNEWMFRIRRRKRGLRNRAGANVKNCRFSTNFQCAMFVFKHPVVRYVGIRRANSVRRKKNHVSVAKAVVYGKYSHPIRR